MERNRFSFRRKGSGKNKNENKSDKENDGHVTGFDYNTLSYVSQKEANDLFGELLTEYSFCLEQTIELCGLSCATAIAQVCRKHKFYPTSSLTKGKGSILVCCGPGRNGAEGLVCARHLKIFGYRPTVFYPKPPCPPTSAGVTAGAGTGGSGAPSLHSIGSCLAAQCEKMDIPFLLYLPSDAQLLTDAYNFIIDAVFGQDHDVAGGTAADYSTIIQTIAKSRVPVVSINVPSGWHVNGNQPEEVSDADSSVPEGQTTPLPLLIQPEMLISLLVPLYCANHFRGKYHILCGRFLPPELAKKFCITLPPYNGSDLWLELKTTGSAGGGVSGGGGSAGVDGEKGGGRKLGVGGQATSKEANDGENWEL